MYESDKEKLADHIIGEAVLALLNDNTPISSASLIARLEVMAAGENDALRQEVIKSAIAEVRRGVPAKRGKRLPGSRDKEGRGAMFDGDAPPAGTKKH
ncbi:hypothetical protein RIN58_08560 [Siccibacter colletis]|uniref:hypothetical protein n=1 Tax=Siccibacter colletis TaxID=1505757 RepID=UPI0028BE6186|nr:hypothetical protein [Siccibacter colletis]WNN50124.1 hypothetical protein RIN58_08560 [Siccibacter colletis]